MFAAFCIILWRGFSALYYTLNHAQLECVTIEKDLGVIVNNTLSWEKHVISVAAKANKLLGLLKHTCPLLMDVSVRRTLYYGGPQVSRQKYQVYTTQLIM